MQRIGKCNNCGACCYVYNRELKRFHLCEQYRMTLPNGHCAIHDKQNFPRECREFPLSPMDLERVTTRCGFQFVDDNGRIIDPYMDKTVRLVKA